MKQSIVLSLLLFVCYFPSTVLATDIGLGWAGKSGMARRVSAGFEKGMKEMAPQVTIEARKELGTVEELAQVAKDWEGSKDGMVLLRSNAAKWLGKNQPAIPTFIGGCNNPEQLGTIRNMAAPEGNITGVTYYLPPEVQFEVFQEIFPDMKAVLLLLGKGNPSALVDQKGTEQVCQKLALGYADVWCEKLDDALSAVKAISGDHTAVVIGNQSLLMDNADKVVAVAGSTPVFAYSDRAVKQGALGGFVADDEKLGYMLAQTVVDVLLNGRSLTSVPVKFDDDPKFFVNLKTAEKLGVELPFAILQAATIIE